MTAYLVTACGAVFLSVVVSFIIPQGRLGKTITATLRLVCIAILISPLVDVFDFSSEAYEDFVDYEYICSVYSKTQSDAMQQVLYEQFAVQSECSVTIIYSDDAFCVEKVEVCLLNANEEIADKIYEYLQADGYINITVYEQTDGGI
ncbi:MAG: hypothetical protein LUD27_03185 [Clostridia bacterium]|nr:hypothetical protein [Clostridia bacterium]